jgi:hypothetical protein
MDDQSGQSGWAQNEHGNDQSSGARQTSERQQPSILRNPTPTSLADMEVVAARGNSETDEVV